MTVETLSGHCPCCGYDKMMMRYGSQGWIHWEGCPNCGFGYCEDHENDFTSEMLGFNAWKHCERHLVAKEEEQLDDLTLRRRLFDFAEATERSDDVKGTLFRYTPEDIATYKDTHPVIFKH